MRIIIRHFRLSEVQSRPAMLGEFWGVENSNLVEFIFGWQTISKGAAGFVQKVLEDA